MKKIVAGDRVVLVTPDRERGLTGVARQPARLIDGESLVSLRLDAEPGRICFYPEKFVAVAEG